MGFDNYQVQNTLPGNNFCNKIELYSSVRSRSAKPLLEDLTAVNVELKGIAHEMVVPCDSIPVDEDE
ncbi:MAG: hypothetical protein ABI763_12940 [Bacteroidota bacterium]